MTEVNLTEWLRASEGPVVLEERESTAHACFGAQVRARGGGIAVEDGSQCLHYAELDRRSARLAGHLVSAGVKPGDCVGVCLERSSAAIVTLLAVLRAGAAYLPIDPRYPRERIAFLVRDAAPVAVVADASERNRVEHPVLVDAAEAEGVGPIAEGGAKIEGSGGDRAYVMYTSGSTGEPKGVEILHRAILRLVRRVSYVHLGPECVVLHAAPLSFDASTFEIWGALLNGGRCVIHREAVPSARGLAATIEEHGITTAWLTAALFNSIVDDDVRALRGLRQLLVGGEALSVPHVQRALGALPDVEIINGYGPTETATFACCHRVQRPLDESARSIPIGRPIRDTRVYLLDSRMRPVPDGEVGEIFIGGDGLARGYLRRAELTAERFLEDPFRPGERVYRTGDLAKRRDDGTVEFLGRADRQVKVRGYRIELGEIEAALAKHAAVKACVVAVREVSPGDKRIVAYLVPRSGPAAVAGLREFAAASLPSFMIPSSYVWIDAVPLTPNGKLDEKALPPAGTERPEFTPYVEPASERERALCSLWADVLRVSPVGATDNVFELGATSLLAVRTAARMRDELGLDLGVVDLYAHPTPRALAAKTEGKREARRAGMVAGSGSTAIAIVGMVGRFPGASSVVELASLLWEGREGIRFFREDEIDAAVPTALRHDPGYVRARGVLEDVDQFDAAFFGVAPKEAEVMDPQQRVLLEVAWHALEDAGHVPERLDGRIGVFAGKYNDTYWSENLLTRQDVIDAVGAFQAMVANEKDYVATRVAHKLDLKGPAISIHTACSTSLVAIAQAVRSLRAGECDVALAGGVSITVPVKSGYLHQEGAMLSKDGHTRSFGKDASGTVFSDGAAMVVLRRLEDAVRDGDTVRAVIRGVAVNNDGAEKASFTAPSVVGQADVIAMAHADAGVEPRSIGYVEAHGTATPLGDPIEVAALVRAFGGASAEQRSCAIGSIKSNIGHTVIAAGVAGVIKAALALERGQVPPSLHCAETNPRIDLSGGPFFVNTEVCEWPGGARPRRAGVSSFGVGGTNAHVVLEQAPAEAAKPASEGPHLLLLSARSAGALDALSGALADELRRGPVRPTLEDVAFTLHAGRRWFPHRAAVVAWDHEQAAARILRRDASLADAGRTAGRSKVVFLFPGQGAQHPGMGRSLYEAEPVFREQVDRCAEAVVDRLGLDLRDVVFAQAQDRDAAAARLCDTRLTQPALFVVELALARLLESWGVRPGGMIGHSVGEFVCAVLSGVMKLEDALSLVAARGRLISDLPRGSMLSVRAPARAIALRLPPELAVASDNAPSLCVVSGPTERVAELRARLEAEGIASRELQTSHAFHSPMMAPIILPFARLVEKVELAAPRVPFVSTLTGDWITEAQARDPAYWARHLRETVRFADAVGRLGTGPPSVLFEVGPRATLVSLVRQQLRDPARFLVVPTLGEEQQAERESVLTAVGQAWTWGVAVDPRGLYAGKRVRRVPLPKYPFERKRFWVDRAPAAPSFDQAPAEPETCRPIPPTNGAAHPPAGKEIIVNSQSVSRVARLANELRQVFEAASGVEIGQADIDRSFLDLGLDSLFLTQAALAVQKRTGVKVTFRQLVLDLTSVRRLSEHVDRALPQEGEAADPPPAPANVFPAAPVSPMASAVPAKPFGAMARISLEDHDARTSPKARARLEALVRRYTARTKASKDWTQQHRATMADPRVVTGFRPPIKELVYPIVVQRSAGARIWDLDGNEYIDCLNGFGCSLFGWQPEFVTRALEKQLQTGHEIGPQTPLAGECADLVCELTGFDRAAFCNTGSEAVLGTVRIARTVTGRSKIALFSGSYHGIFDEVIVRGTKSGTAVPAAPGILSSTAENVLVLDYGAASSLATLRAEAGDLAAVLVEPVQSRRPELQPREFLHELRRLTEESGTVLIFDEVITGFRTCPGGAQEYFDVRADLASYGKVIGGGMPVGVIAGKRAFMDPLDGGHWAFGDPSVPTVGVTYFAGTFVRHPLALAAVKSVLTHLKKEGPALQRETNAKTERLAVELNAFFAAVGAPLAVRHFGSLWRVNFTAEEPWGDLLFVLLRDRGIHILDGFPCFFTTAHTAGDADAIVGAFKGSISEMQESGFLPEKKTESASSGVSLDGSRPPVPGARLGRDLEGRPAWFVPNPSEPGKYLKLEAAS